MSTDFLVPYPQGVVRQLFRAPILGYRFGFGGLINAAQIMVLTTRGRSSGIARHAAIEYRQHGSKIYIISAWGERPHWYRNLVECSEVTVQRGSNVCAATAQVVTDSGEALRVLHLFRRRAPGIYDSIIARLSARESIDSRTLHEVTEAFTIVRIIPHAGEPSLPPVEVDSGWMMPAAIIGVGLLLIGAVLRLRADKQSS